MHRWFIKSVCRQQVLRWPPRIQYQTIKVIRHGVGRAGSSLRPSLLLRKLRSCKRKCPNNGHPASSQRGASLVSVCPWLHANVPCDSMGFPWPTSVTRDLHILQRKGRLCILAMILRGLSDHPHDYRKSRCLLMEMRIFCPSLRQVVSTCTPDDKLLLCALWMTVDLHVH